MPNYRESLERLITALEMSHQKPFHWDKEVKAALNEATYVLGHLVSGAVDAPVANDTVALARCAALEDRLDLIAVALGDRMVGSLPVEDRLRRHRDNLDNHTQRLDEDCEAIDAIVHRLEQLEKRAAKSDGSNAMKNLDRQVAEADRRRMGNMSSLFAQGKQGANTGDVPEQSEDRLAFCTHAHPPVYDINTDKTSCADCGEEVNAIIWRKLHEAELYYLVLLRDGYLSQSVFVQGGRADLTPRCAACRKALSAVSSDELKCEWCHETYRRRSTGYVGPVE